MASYLESNIFRSETDLSARTEKSLVILALTIATSANAQRVSMTWSGALRKTVVSFSATAASANTSR